MATNQTPDTFPTLQAALAYVGYRPKPYPYAPHGGCLCIDTTDSLWNVCTNVTLKIAQDLSEQGSPSLGSDIWADLEDLVVIEKSLGYVSYVWPDVSYCEATATL